MKWHLPQRETIFEIGLAAFAASLAGGLGAIVFGRLLGATVRKARHDERAPEPGSVPPERHRNIGNVAAR